jgi:3,4-dihydroxy 2-butanone 4-phosphate synthase/GTP cyclohydrolase II
MSGFSRMEEALEALAKGGMIIVADAEERENEGDFVIAAEKVTPDSVHFMITEGRGQLCMPLRTEIARRLHLRPMVPNKSLSVPCFTIPVDHRFCHTGISPKERAFTIQMVIDGATRPEDFVRPGHVFPLIARDGGVLQRPGHTEATVDLMRMAGLAGAGVLCEICSRDGRNMATGDELMQIAETFHLPIITIDDVIHYRQLQVATSAACSTPNTHSAPAEKAASVA